MDVLDRLMRMVADGGGLGPGEQDAWVLNDAVVYAEMSPDMELQIKVVVGEPKRVDITLGLAASATNGGV